MGKNGGIGKKAVKGVTFNLEKVYFGLKMSGGLGRGERRGGI